MKNKKVHRSIIVKIFTEVKMPIVKISNNEIEYTAKILPGALGMLDCFVDDYCGSEYKLYLDGELLGSISYEGLEEFEFEFRTRLKENYL